MEPVDKVLSVFDNHLVIILCFL